ncbi:hypothetical protein GYMLUDRAFT_62973 [Collybiopsis luxurians FD-317 M1]|uniref:Extracellular serine-rich protein n=1 Tax=Collybiopsis luxurians FD-317 M1 TaxID=944289 RepID=A0A0D0C9U3_9AGAR|nr:hypothetical protein GYMLUDRAFT_62973 [Collybiopsis luxurians FD-317 M1]
MMHFLTLACLGLATLVQAQNQVQVGGTENEANGGLYQFNPNTFNATNGSVITFEFTGNPGNHSITQSSFSSPCQPLDGGFDSGWVLIPNNGVSPVPQWNLTITDDSKPIWFFCKQSLPIFHCPAGMVGAINAPTSGSNTFQNYVTNARQQQSSGQGIGFLVGQGASASAVPSPLPNGVTLFGTPSSGSATSASTSSSSSSSSSSSAGHMVQSNSLVALLAALMGIALA